MAMIVCFPVDRKFPCALDAVSRHRIAGRRRRRSIAIAVPEIALSRRRSGIQVARTLFAACLRLSAKLPAWLYFASSNVPRVLPSAGSRISNDGLSAAFDEISSANRCRLKNWRERGKSRRFFPLSLRAEAGFGNGQFAVIFENAFQ